MSLHDRFWSRHDDDTIVGRAWGRAPIYMRIFEVLPDVEAEPVALSDTEKQEFARLFLVMANRESDPDMTKGQRAILDFCRGYWSRAGEFPPSNQIQAATGLERSWISHNLQRLADMGVLIPPESGARSGRMRIPEPRTAEDHLRAPA